MRALLLTAFMTTVTFASLAAADPASLDLGALPRDEASLRELDNLQLRIVRRAGAQCWHTGEARFLINRGPRARACIISLTESAIANSDNAALKSYHATLPFGARYDEFRSVSYWQRLVERE